MVMFVGVVFESKALLSSEGEFRVLSVNVKIIIHTQKSRHLLTLTLSLLCFEIVFSPFPSGQVVCRLLPPAGHSVLAQLSNVFVGAV